MTKKIDLDELERKARAATPGPWTASEPAAAGMHPRQPAGSAQVRCDDATERVPSGCLIPFFVIHVTDAQHIAANSPPVTLALIARIRELEAAVEMAWRASRQGKPCPLTGDLDALLEKGAVLP